MNLTEYLKNKEVEAGLFSVIESLAVAVKQISEAVRTASTGKAGTTNIYGEEQLALDVLADRLLVEELGKNSAVGLVASEEMENEKKLSAGEYAVCFDPLDGSSLVDSNLTVGTIAGVYKTGTFFGVKGEQQLAALVAVYGPRTTFFLTVRKGVAQFTLKGGEFILTHSEMRVAEEGKMFAPGNLRACKSRKDYLKLVNYWCENEYTLRYSGGMVPDVMQILVKGKGVFTYPGYDGAPHGKLRLLFECAPMALLMEQAGGAATDGMARILEKEVKDLAQRTPILIGSSGEVDTALKFLS